MKLIKIELRNKTGEEFLKYYMLVYIENELANKTTSEEIITAFELLRNHKVKFK